MLEEILVFVEEKTGPDEGAGEYLGHPEDVIRPHFGVRNLGDFEPFGFHFFGFGWFTGPTIGFVDDDLLIPVGFRQEMIKIQDRNLDGIGCLDADLFFGFSDGGGHDVFAGMRFTANAVPFAQAKASFFHGKQDFVASE